MSLEPASTSNSPDTQNIKSTEQNSNHQVAKNKKIIIFVISTVLLVFVISIITLLIIKRKKSQRSDSQSTEEEELSFDNPEKDTDPFGDPNGPFYHEISIASSTDGLNYDKEDRILISKASVPDVVQLSNGRWILYAVDAGGRSTSGLLIGISDDQGETWQFGSLHIETSRTKSVVGCDPEIVLLEDGSLRLYYLVSEKPTSGYNQQVNNKILSATSSDGIHFVEENGTRFEYTNITDPDVVKIDNMWYIYLSQGPKLIATTSIDGLEFTLSKTIREKGSVSNTVHLDTGTWRQFYCNNGIMSATSSDGLTWKNDSGYRLQPDADQFICDPVPIKYNASWVLIYKIAPKT